MATKNRRQAKSKSNVMDDFRISNGPVIRSAEEAGMSTANFGDVAELPRPHGAPGLFAIARDPRTIFTYWSIDWPRVFAQTIPVDRQVHLRVYRGDGALEMSAAVEPMAGNSYLTVSQPRGVYRVEVGYYQPEGVWNSVAISNKERFIARRISCSSEVNNSRPSSVRARFWKREMVSAKAAPSVAPNKSMRR